jgi:NADH dehydrogenase/NADH:ubiquinone oxidoreductase subunit G
MPTITIDNRGIEVAEGATVLEAATRLGIYIPTLCDHPAVEPYGACRLCMVEIVSGGRSTLATACTYPARDGLTVRTVSDGVLKARQFIIELLLARCPNSEEIRTLARKLGVEGTRFPSADEGRTCILCGLCVRVCRELIGSAAISFIHRGMERAVETPFQIESDACIGCGACAFVCPTGAIAIEDCGDNRRMETWHTGLRRATCARCGEYFTTVEVLDRVKEALDLPEEILTCCSRCRRKKLGEELCGAQQKG